MIEIYKYDEIYVTIKCDESQARELKDYVSCYIPNRFFNPLVKRKLWNGKISFFDLKTHELPIGLFSMFNTFCKERGYTYKFCFDSSELCTNVHRSTIEKFTERLLVTAYTSENKKIDAYDYQIDAVHNALSNKRGILQCATSSGKSLMLYIIIRMLLTKSPDFKFILIVPTINLVTQMFQDFDDYGWDEIKKYCTRMCTGYKPDFSKNVLITTYQSVYKKPKKFFEKYDVLICDEAHQAKNLSIRTIAQKCVNAEYRIGTTGTLPEEPSDRMNIFGYLGTIIYTVMYNDLIDRNVLAKMKIVNFILKYPKEMVDKNKIGGGRSYHEEKETCNTYVNRNSIIEMILEKSKDGDNTLILAENIDHLKRITEYLEEHLPDKYLIENIHGKVKPSEREAIRRAMEKETNMVLIASYGTTSTGVSIKKINNIVFASSYKSKIKVLQSIGRGLRTHTDKEQLLLYDLVDDLTWVKRTGNVGMNHIYKHYLERKKYYNEQGFQCFIKELNI